MLLFKYDKAHVAHTNKNKKLQIAIEHIAYCIPFIKYS